MTIESISKGLPEMTKESLDKLRAHIEEVGADSILGKREEDHRLLGGVDTGCCNCCHKKARY